MRADHSSFSEIKEFNRKVEQHHVERFLHYYPYDDSNSLKHMNKVSGVKARREILKKVLNHPKENFLNVLTKDKQIFNHLWENEDYLNTLIEKLYYDNDSLIREFKIVEQLIDSDSCKIESLYAAFEIAKYGDLDFVVDAIKSKIPDIDKDSSSQIRIHKNDLKKLLVLFNISRQRVISNGALYYSTFEIKPEVYDQFRKFKWGYEVFHAIENSHYYIDDSSFISNLVLEDYSTILMLWNIKGDSIKSVNTFDKLFNTGKFTSVIVDSIYYKSIKSKIAVIRTKGADGSYGWETVTFYEWDGERTLKEIYSIHGGYDGETKEENVIKYKFYSENSRIKIDHIVKDEGCA